MQSIIGTPGRKLQHELNPRERLPQNIETLLFCWAFRYPSKDVPSTRYGM